MNRVFKWDTGRLYVFDRVYDAIIRHITAAIIVLINRHNTAMLNDLSMQFFGVLPARVRELSLSNG